MDTATGHNGITLKLARPTLRHRLAIAPGILGTVYGVNERGEARYFDYDMAAAYAFAGVTQKADPRLSKPPEANVSYIRFGAVDANPRRTRRCVWVLRSEGARS